jgi:hypothetical protein
VNPATLARRQSVSGAITVTLLMLARLTATTALTGLWAVCSLVPVLGFTVLDGWDTGVGRTAGTVVRGTDIRAGVAPTTAAVGDMVMLAAVSSVEATPAAGDMGTLAVVSPVEAMLADFMVGQQREEASMAAVDSTAAADSTVVVGSTVAGIAKKIASQN